MMGSRLLPFTSFKMRAYAPPLLGLVERPNMSIFILLTTSGFNLFLATTVKVHIFENYVNYFG
jgi:hypothetical protein